MLVSMIVLLTDIIGLAYDQLIEQITAAREGGPEVNRTAPLLMAAWSIVDQVHALRSVFRTTHGETEPEILAWLNESAGAHELRNWMDHLHQRIPNLSKRKNAEWPVLGSVGSMEVFHGPEQNVDAFIVMAGAGYPTGDAYTPTPRLEVGNVQAGVVVELYAFGERFPLSEVVNSLEVLLPTVATTLHDRVRKGIEQRDFSPEERAEAERPYDIYTFGCGPISLTYLGPGDDENGQS